MGVKAGLIPHFSTCLRQAGRGARGGFDEGKRQGNVLMTVLLNPIKDPERLEWNEVHPEQRLNAAERVKKVDH